MQEIYKDIRIIDWIDFNWLYQISNLWNIKSLEKKTKTKWWVLQIRKEKIIKGYKDKDWYLFVRLSNNYKVKNLRIHRLVGLYFLDNKDNKPCINHINWIKDNNIVDNLEWCSYSENEIHKRKVLWFKNNFETNHPYKWLKWEKHFNSKKVNQYTLEWEFIKTWWSLSDITIWLWIATSNISKCCKWWYKTCWWFIWKYL